MTDTETVGQEILSRLQPASRSFSGVEVGVHRGDLSHYLLYLRENLILLLVDAWQQDNGNVDYRISGDYHSVMFQDVHDEAFGVCAARMKEFPDRATIVAARSLQAASLVADDRFDFVFIDADHSYSAIKADLAAWLPKVKAGGWIGGHDYDNPTFPNFGVKRAVDERFGSRVVLGDFMTWFVQL